MKDFSGPWTDIGVAAACFGSLLLYNGWYFGRRVLAGVHQTTHIRRAWVEETMNSPDDSLLVVQTLRNLIIAATLMVTGLAQILGRLVAIITKDSGPEPKGHEWVSTQTKLTLALAVLFLALVMLSLSVRLAVHLGFMIPLKSRRRHSNALRSNIQTSMHSCTLYFSAGLRMLVLSLPIMGWVAGNPALISSTLLVLALSWHVDSGSKEAEDLEGEESMAQCLMGEGA
ncbi:hypothetical protein ACKKBG_A36805 [Auxenochlorella protothecoides x Auxenochlorella symbiontica]